MNTPTQSLYFAVILSSLLIVDGSLVAYPHLKKKHGYHKHTVETLIVNQGIRVRRLAIGAEPDKGKRAIQIL